MSCLIDEHLDFLVKTIPFSFLVPCFFFSFKNRKALISIVADFHFSCHSFVSSSISFKYVETGLLILSI